MSDILLPLTRGGTPSTWTQKDRNISTQSNHEDQIDRLRLAPVSCDFDEGQQYPKRTSPQTTYRVQSIYTKLSEVIGEEINIPSPTSFEGFNEQRRLFDSPRYSSKYESGSEPCSSDKYSTKGDTPPPSPESPDTVPETRIQLEKRGYTPEHDSCDTAVAKKVKCQDGGDISQWPQEKGWHDPNTRFAKAVRHATEGWNREDLLEAFWAAPTGPRYRSQGFRKTDMKTSPCGNGNSDHARKEANRRVRHRYIQEIGHAITTDLAETLAEQDEKFREGRLDAHRARSTFQVPSKDHQLFSSVYGHYIAARVVHSEHQGRIEAEQTAAYLKARLLAVQRSLNKVVEQDFGEDVRQEETLNSLVKI